MAETFGQADCSGLKQSNLEPNLAEPFVALSDTLYAAQSRTIFPDCPERIRSMPSRKSLKRK
jgi:hypothetical protein